jgi:hypothetical protein
VKGIAAELHFADESQLCHQFKAYFNCTASEFVVFYCGRKAAHFGRMPTFPKAVIHQHSAGVPLWHILTNQ